MFKKVCGSGEVDSPRKFIVIRNLILQENLLPNKVYFLRTLPVKKVYYSSEVIFQKRLLYFQQRKIIVLGNLPRRKFAIQESFFVRGKLSSKKIYCFNKPRHKKIITSLRRVSHTQSIKENFPWQKVCCLLIKLFLYTYIINFSLNSRLS